MYVAIAASVVILQPAIYISGLFTLRLADGMVSQMSSGGGLDSAPSCFKRAGSFSFYVWNYPSVRSVFLCDLFCASDNAMLKESR